MRTRVLDVFFSIYMFCSRQRQIRLLSINTDFYQILSLVDSNFSPFEFRETLRGFKVYYQKLIVQFLFHQESTHNAFLMATKHQESIVCAFFRLPQHQIYYEIYLDVKLLIDSWAKLRQLKLQRSKRNPLNPTSPREAHGNVLIRNNLALMCRGL